MKPAVAPTTTRTPTPGVRPKFLQELDYSVVQQCMHCGMCLPTCPTYVETGRERNSPRGRIALMRAIADGDLGITRSFGEEMSYCLGCLACVSACPAGVDYAHLFENARADVEQAGVMTAPRRAFWRRLSLRWIFMRPRLLRLAGRMLYLVQRSGLQTVARRLRLTRLLPAEIRELEPQTPPVCRHFSPDLIAAVEEPPDGEPARYRVALLTGCVQDLLFSDINRDTADILRAHGCTVVTPRAQPCCGSLHAHNGEPELARVLARRLLDLIPPDNFDAIITNAGGCGSHLKHYGRLLADDPAYAARAQAWDAKLKDVHEWIVSIGVRPPAPAADSKEPTPLTYHESCHLCHGQKISGAPRAVLDSIPGYARTELPEATWCCGSAGVYNITQPAQAAKLQQRKVGHLARTGAQVVATANPGCHLQLANGLREKSLEVSVAHPVSLWAAAWRAHRADQS